MAKRILNMTAEEMTHATKSELIEAIAGSEGRVLASETIGITIPLLTDVTNAEFAASMCRSQKSWHCRKWKKKRRYEK